MQVKLIYTRKVLSPTNINLAKYAINPYRGCEFGCNYCYSQSLKSAKKYPQILGVKINSPEILEKELFYRRMEKVILGSNCECFTYIEKTYGITEKIINILNKNNVPLIILTKSHLISSYLNILSNSKIFFTFNFSHEKIKSLLEDNSPSLKMRLTTLEKIQKANIPLRIHIGPYIPYLCNLEDIFKLVKGLCKEINIELYNSKVGNFFLIMDKIRSLNKSWAEAIENIYSNKEQYYLFSEKLKDDCIEINKRYNFKIYFIVPEFDNFYDSKIDYENTLL
ncbi:MAG: hypothetical protein NC822_06525 [Candidatus Omnitrophica bacterium]|nr:hypothetical protein [Candidatus Omnitrophota bacterium]MCM8826486.1 hypothetical protein [Candidatus Omnitrophota bacterium]